MKFFVVVLTRTLFVLPLVLIILLSACFSNAAPNPLAAYPPLPNGYKSIKVFDRHGRFVGRLLPEKRYWTSINQIPVFLQNAVVAVEDVRFYEHSGIDLRGIARAVVKDVVKGRLAEGGSTITQQLIKNKYLSNEKTIDRKVNEGLMAIDFEKKYTKKQILEMYFNEIYYGHGIWGIGQAARFYFDKNPEELNEAESVILAGIPKNPGRYNPLARPADVGMRKAVVLKRLLDAGMIKQSAIKQIQLLSAAPVPKNHAPYYLAHLREILLKRYGSGILEQGGLEITSAMNLSLQTKAEKILSESVKRLSKDLQGALVSVDPANGDLLVAVGGVDFVKGPYNRAFLAKRQPGSAIKPFIYAAVVEKGVTLAAMKNDEPEEYQQGNNRTWKPKNYDGKSHGMLSLRQALSSSNNVITVKLLDHIGITAFTDLAARAGLDLHLDNLSLALGTEEVTLSNLVTAYTVFANSGIRAELRSIIRIYDSYRKSWTENRPQTVSVIDPAVAFIITDVLKDVLKTGTAARLKKFSLKYHAAGKTGTTSDYRDAWFIGYTPNLVTGVWLGYDQPRPGGKKFTGGSVAAPIWERFMLQAMAVSPASDFKMPDNVISLSYDPITGLLADPESPSKREELFIVGTEPSEYSAPLKEPDQRETAPGQTFEQDNSVVSDRIKDENKEQAQP